MFGWLKDKNTPSDGWVEIYSLKKDKKRIKDIQRTTLETEDYGIRPEIALFGSRKWWKSIDNGLISKHELQGKISKVYMSGHNDYPEFEVETDIKTRTQWTREVNNADMDHYYIEGKTVRIVYVIEKFKKDFGIGLETESVLSIHIKEENDR